MRSNSSTKPPKETTSSNSPCAVYNFYNCCDPSHSSNASASASFIWQSGNILDPFAQPGPQEVLTPVIGLVNTPDADLKNYQGLMPLHKKARLIEISIIRFPGSLSGPAYTATVKFSLVVLDFNGGLIRTISTAPIDYQSIPLRTWTPISISTVTGDLDIPAGQLVAGELTFGAALTAGQTVRMQYQLSGTGMLL
jgi:hypothetical protein